MNKYKVNLIYKEDGLNLTEIVIKTLIKELKMICNKDYFDVSCSCTYLSLEKGGKD